MSDKFAFIWAEKANYPLTRACQWMGVSRSGLYEWLERLKDSADKLSVEIDLTLKIRAAFMASQMTYGARRIRKYLEHNHSTVVSRRSVRAIMARENLIPRPIRSKRRTTISATDVTFPSDLLVRDFSAPAPGAKLVGDITYMRTTSGWLYLATVIDCCCKEVVGWAIQPHMKASLVVEALEMASRRVRITPGETVFHSDRGSQYLSGKFQRALTQLNIRQSVGRTGTALDNALAESFFGFLKSECLYRYPIADQHRTRAQVVAYIEDFYNTERLHSSLNYRSPNQVHEEYLKTKEVA